MMIRGLCSSAAAFRKAAAAVGSILVAAVCSTLVAQPVLAQAYPSKPIRFVFGFPAGSATDTLFRPVMEHMSGTLGQPIVMDAHPGGGGMVAALHIKSQPPDGYAFYFGSTSLINAALRQPEAINLRRDFTPICVVTSAPLLIAVNADTDIKTFKDLIDQARAKPGQLNYASYGIGSGAHVFMEWLQSEAKIKLTHVPYQGISQAMLDLVAGRVQVTATIVASARPYAKELGGSGKIRLLATGTRERSPLVPDVPGMREVGYPQLDLPLWGGFLGPAGMPRNVVDTLAHATDIAYKDPKIVEMANRFGQAVTFAGSEELQRLMQHEYDATTKLIKEAGLKLE
jgi:tripartite-type tricarboxylate transporter receptor subunit TctC